MYYYITQTDCIIYVIFDYTAHKSIYYIYLSCIICYMLSTSRYTK